MIAFMPSFTHQFSAPELCPVDRSIDLDEHQKTYNKEVDVWLLGCIVFNMLTGFPPFYD